jgi:hypothetical protein
MFTSSLTWAIKRFQNEFPHVLLTLHDAHLRGLLSKLREHAGVLRVRRRSS